jgi:hypothetical protein
MSDLNGTRRNFQLSSCRERLQIDRIHRFLSTEAYWCRGIPKDTVANATRSSLCVGIYDLQGLRRICLTTKDAHKLYLKYGFSVTETPENWMEIKNNEIYQNT